MEPQNMNTEQTGQQPTQNPTSYPYANNEHTEARSPGSAFYAGLIVGYVFFFMASKQRKKSSKSERSAAGRPGLLTFFSSTPAAVFDVVFVLSLIMTVISVATGERMPDVLIYFFISTLIFSAQMRAIVNGINFRTIFGMAGVRGKRIREES